MSGYRGFASKKDYEKYYSGALPKWEIDAMEVYCREAEEERIYIMDHEQQLKLTALDRAIQCNSGHTYNDEGRNIVNPDNLLKAARKFEAYLKGTDNANEVL